jgi:hypothetical protein
MWLTSLLAGVAAGCSGAPTPPAHPDFSGLWQVADPILVVRPDVNAKPEEYTATARTNIEDYRKHWDANTDDPAKFCVRHGMPNTMTSRARDYLVDVNQTSSRITVLVEFMDNFRVIHFDASAVPENVAPSNNGYSTARWNGDTLLVETSALKAKSPVGLMQRSAAAHINERWTMRSDAAHGQVLEINMDITDPEVFVATARARQVYKRAPAGSQLNEYACADALWDDHVEAVKAQRK